MRSFISTPLRYLSDFGLAFGFSAFFGFGSGTPRLPASALPLS